MTPTDAEVSRGLKEIHAVLEAMVEPDRPVPPEIAARVRRDRLFGQLGERAIALLRELEWVDGERDLPSQNDKGEYRPCTVFVANCPVCLGLESEGHSPDCRLAALLKEAEG